MKTLQELNKKICEALGVNYDDFLKMKSDEQRKIVNRYVTEVKGLKFKNHK
jgi:hypothetical protein